MSSISIGDAIFTEVAGGTHVRQGPYQVVLRNRKLNTAFEDAVRFLFDNGFAHLFPIHPASGLPQSRKIRENGDAATHAALSFTQSPYQRWIFVIDDQSGDDISHVILNKAYETMLVQSGLDLERERRNTKNFRVRFENLGALLSVMSKEAVEAIDSRLTKRGGHTAK